MSGKISGQILLYFGRDFVYGVFQVFSMHRWGVEPLPLNSSYMTPELSSPTGVAGDGMVDRLFTRLKSKCEESGNSYVIKLTNLSYFITLIHTYKKISKIENNGCGFCFGSLYH